MSRRKRQKTLTKEQLNWWSKEYCKAIRNSANALPEIIAYINTVEELAERKVKIVEKYLKIPQ